MTDRRREADLSAILSDFANPEAINERPEHAPSKRI